MSEIVTRPQTSAVAVAPLSARDIQAQVNAIQEVMAQVMTKDVHYGVVPGCGDKPTLLKPGAEKLFMTFRLRPIVDPDRDVKVRELPGGHREVVIYTHVLNADGLELATGIGSCSSMESKYRWRNEGRKCPKCGAETIIKGREEYGGGWLCHAKRGGCGAKFEDDDAAITKQKTGKVENPDIADVYNTVLKIADKRSSVSGCLKATAASDIFTQDIEDLPPEMLGGGGAAKPAQSAKPAAAAASGGDKKPADSQEPRRASSGSQAPAGEKKSVTGTVAKKYAPKGNSAYFSWTMEGSPKEYLQSKDAEVIAAMDEAGKNSQAVTVHFDESVNGKYTNRIIYKVDPVDEAEQADPDGSAQEPEEQQVGD